MIRSAGVTLRLLGTRAGEYLHRPNQRKHWEKWHRNHDHASHLTHAELTRRIFLCKLERHTHPCNGMRNPGDEAVEAGDALSCTMAPHNPVRPLRVLEIGCGQGRDALAMAGRHHVVAFDRSPTALDRVARGVSGRGGVKWFLANYADSLPLRDMSFDGVYAHLSLHYLDEPGTADLIAEIARVLRPDGLLLFTVRCTDDPLYERGKWDSANVYVHNGHLRHFFDEPYTRKLLCNWHEVGIHQYDTRNWAVNPGVFLRAWGRRPAE